MINSLSGRFLILTALFVMVAEVLIFVPSIARFREEYIWARLERAQIASLALLASEDMIAEEVEAELLANAGVMNVVLRRDSARQLVLSSPIPSMVSKTVDLRDDRPMVLITDALHRLFSAEPEVVRIIGEPVMGGGLQIEIALDSRPLRAAMLDYGRNILVLSLVISLITAALLFVAVRRLLVRPIQNLVGNMEHYSAAPEDVTRIVEPNSSVRELRSAQSALAALETELTTSLKQKERLAQLGGAVAKISHDLRNILTTTTLLGDRLETVDDPTVQRVAPKLVASISRAVALCEGTLAFGKAEEGPPMLQVFNLHTFLEDLVDAEQLAVPAQDVTITADVPDDLTLRADPEQMYRVVGNLIRNARQALQATKAPGQVQVSAMADGTDRVIRVKDTGPGLPAKAQDHLFEAFQGNVRKGGTGLGLAIAAELVRGHGGDLSLESTGETGTVFTIRLPQSTVLEKA